jgi:hypothetical protein
MKKTILVCHRIKFFSGLSFNVLLLEKSRVLPLKTACSFSGNKMEWLVADRCKLGRVIAQAVSRRLPTAAARVRALVWLCGICGGQSGAGAGFLRVLRFPPPIFIPPIAPQSPSSVIWGWYNRPVVAAVPSGLSLTPQRIKKDNKYM